MPWDITEQDILGKMNREAGIINAFRRKRRIRAQGCAVLPGMGVTVLYDHPSKVYP